MISVTLYVEVLPLFSVINQRNLIFVKHSKHRGHETEIGVFFLLKRTILMKVKIALHFECRSIVKCNLYLYVNCYKIIRLHSGY